MANEMIYENNEVEVTEETKKANSKKKLLMGLGIGAISAAAAVAIGAVIKHKKANAKNAEEDSDDNVIESDEYESVE